MKEQVAVGAAEQRGRSAKKLKPKAPAVVHRAGLGRFGTTGWDVLRTGGVVRRIEVGMELSTQRKLNAGLQTIERLVTLACEGCRIPAHRGEPAGPPERRWLDGVAPPARV